MTDANLLKFIRTSALAITSCGCRAVSNTLADVESYIQDRPDSALAVLKGIDGDRLLTPARKAHYSLLYAMALDKNYIDTTYINVIKPAVDYFRNHGSPDERLKALYYEERIYFNAQEYTKAIASYSEALPDLDRARDLKSCGMLCRDIGVTYNKTYGDEEPVL